MTITITSPCSQSTIKDLEIGQWPIWSCEPSTFPWTYDEQETCLLVEGDVTVTPDGGKPVRFGAGDLVVFPAGLSCTWEVHLGGAPGGAQALPLWLSRPSIPSPDGDSHGT